MPNHSDEHQSFIQHVEEAARTGFTESGNYHNHQFAELEKIGEGIAGKGVAIGGLR